MTNTLTLFSFVIRHSSFVIFNLDSVPVLFFTEDTSMIKRAISDRARALIGSVMRELTWFAVYSLLLTGAHPAGNGADGLESVRV